MDPSRTRTRKMKTENKNFVSGNSLLIFLATSVFLIMISTVSLKVLLAFIVLLGIVFLMYSFRDELITYCIESNIERILDQQSDEDDEEDMGDFPLNSEK